MDKNKGGIILIIIATLCWGIICLATRPLGALGLSSLQITAFRLLLTTIIMAIFILLKDKKLFKFSVKDLPIFIIAGANFFALIYLYITSIEENNSSSVAAMLLYTSPVWITVFSRIAFKEKVSIVRILALFGTIGGLALMLLTQEISVSKTGLIVGILSGLSYGLYSIFGKVLTKHNRSETNTFYTFLFSSVVSIFFIRPKELYFTYTVNPLQFILLFLLLVIVMTIIPYNLYTESLRKIPVSVAGIISILEPVVACICGIIFFKDPINVYGVIGIIVVILSLVFLELENKIIKKNDNENVKTENEL